MLPMIVRGQSKERPTTFLALVLTSKQEVKQLDYTFIFIKSFGVLKSILIKGPRKGLSRDKAHIVPHI